MTRKTVLIDDISGEQLNEDNAIEVVIRKPGYMFEIDGGSYTNELVLHVKESDLDKIKKKVKIKKMQMLDVL